MRAGRTLILGVLLLSFLGGCAPSRATSKNSKTSKPKVNAPASQTAKPPTRVPPHVLEEIKAHYQRGVDFHNRGQFDLAQKEYESALEIAASSNSAKFALPYYGLGLTFLRLEKAGAAADAFSKALANKPDFYQAYHGLGLTQRLLGKHREAERSYLAALRYGKNDPKLVLDVYFNLGILYDAYLNDAVTARKYYEEYIRLRGPEAGRVQTWMAKLAK